ncbi:right-handed parallel beta-helix repeat-containing protein [bacterium]|nr:right-handed parallel beta-helix repeat-containing protein [bacterium]
MNRKIIQHLLSVWIVVMLMISFINIAQAYEEVSGVIPDGTVWTTGTTYYVIGSVTINSGTTLTIEPGVFVKFAPSTGMTIYGTLDAQATNSLPTYFTSKDDDTVGEIVDGSDGTPAPNDWSYLYPNGIGSSSSVLDYAIIRYGNYGIYCSGSDLTIQNSSISDSHNDGLYVNNASPRIIGGDIAFNGRHGINLNSAAPTISSVEIRSNGIRGTYHGIYGTNSAPTISNGNIYDNSGSGIYVTGLTSFTISGNTISGHTGDYGVGIISSAATIMDNTITGNTYPLAVTGLSIFTYSDNSIAGNTYNTAMAVFGSVNGILYNSDNLPEPLTAYVVTDSLTVPTGKFLLIQPGTVVKSLSGKYVTINGTLSARASAGSEIVFTSFKDDEYGGDTNADGGATIPEPNDWGYLYPNGVNSSGSVIDYCIIRYGNRGIYCSGSDLTISNNSISDSYYDGIYITNASPGIIGNIIESNGRYGIYFNPSSSVLINNSIINNDSYGVYLNGSSQPTIGSDPAELVNWNDIHGNDTYDLYNNTSNDIVACPIYWGTLDQTDIEMRIYDQEDNPAKGKVNCIPWTNAEHDTLYDGTSKASPTRLPVVELNKVKTNNVEESLPDKFSLLQNYPNPFNPDTWIPYSLPQSADVTIRIYNVSGNVVRKINLAHQAAGFYLSKDKAIYWNGRNDYGEKVPSGVYFYQIKAGKFISVKKAVIAK